MLTFDQLKALPDRVIQAYGRLKAERLIESAPPKRQLYYQALQARTQTRLRKIKNPYLRAELAIRIMHEEGTFKLNEALKGETK